MSPAMLSTIATTSSRACRKALSALHLSLPLAAVVLVAVVPAGAQDVLTPGDHVVVDQLFGFGIDPDTGQDFSWSGFALVDGDIDATQDPDPSSEIQVLFDSTLLQRVWNIHVISRDEILLADSFADPAGLGNDPNPENNNLGAGDDTGGHGAIYLANLDTGRLDVVSDGTLLTGGLPAGAPSAFTGPRDLIWAEDGFLYVVDPDSNASGLGFDTGRPDVVDSNGDPFPPHAGVGGILRVDLETGEATLIADGTGYTGSFPDLDNDGTADPSIFVDPWAVTQNPAEPGVFYLLDALADPNGAGDIGAVFRVDIATGQVDLVASDARWTFPVDIAWKESLGRLLLLDASAANPLDPRVFSINPADGIVNVWSDPDDFEFPQNIYTDLNDQVYVVDTDADPLNFGFLVGPGAVFHLPDANPGMPDVVSSTEDTIFLVSGDTVPAGPYPQLDPLALPGLCAGSTVSVNLTGTGFDADARVVGTGELEVLSFTWVDASNMTADITVTCAAQGGDLPLRVLNPATGLSDTTDVSVDLAQSDPRPPASAVGDLNGDTLVDGLDFARIGLAFGTNGCCDPQFNNDADLNNDGIVDGLDITVFAPSFGIRLGP